MGGCCGAMKTGQKSLPDKKKSADPIQEKPNGKEAAQATVSANDTGKASPIDKGEIHAEEKPKDGESHAQEQIAVPVKVSFSHAEPGQVAVEPSVQVAENVMDLETAVAPFESLASTGDQSQQQQEAQGSITSAEPEVLLPFQIPVQHAFTSTTTTTTTTTRHEDDHEEFKLRVEELQLDSAFPGDVQLSITENVQDVPFEQAPAPGDVEIHAKSFSTAEVEALPQPLSAEKVEVGVEDAVARVERAILEAQLPVEEDLPPPPPLEASQPEELEAGGRIEVNASYPEVPMDPEAMWRAGIMVCPLERRPSPPPEFRRGRPPGVVVCPLERIERLRPGPDAGYTICPIGQTPEPEVRLDSGLVIGTLERIPEPEPKPRSEWEIETCEPCLPELEPRPDSGIMICPLERIPEPEPKPMSELEIETCEPCLPEPEPNSEWETQTCEPCLPEPEPNPEWETQTCEPCLPEPEPTYDPTICVCPLEEIPFPRPEPRPEPVIAVCPPRPEPRPRPEPEIAICPPEPELVISPPEPLPEPDIVVCPAPEPEILTDLDTQPASEDPTVVHESAHVQEAGPASLPDSISFGESTVTEEAMMPVHVPSQEAAFTEESHFQEQVPIELGFGSKLEEELQVPAQDNLPPPVVEEPVILDSLLESYEVLDASTEQLPQPPPVVAACRRGEPIFAFIEQITVQPLPLQTEQTAVTVQQGQPPEEPAPYQEKPDEVMEPYHEHPSEAPAPYQEHQTGESSFQSEQLQDPASQHTSGQFEETGDAVQSSLQEQEQPREASDTLPVLEVVSEQAQESRDAWWNESGKEQSGLQQVTTDDIPVLELVSEQVREAHQIWWDQPGAATEAAHPNEATTSSSLLDTAQPPTEQGSSAEEPLSIPLPEGESISPPIATDGSFSEVIPEPVSSFSDHVVGQQEAEIIPEGKALPLPVVESPSSADGSSSSNGPTENGEVSTQSSDETSASNLSPESIDGPAPAVVAAVSTEEAIPTQA